MNVSIFIYTFVFLVSSPEGNKTLRIASTSAVLTV